MPYEVLARKWRPQTFEDVIGQEHITHTLTNAMTTDRLAHAYLFSGPRGVGKTSVARILAKAINCRQGAPGVPCNECRSCKEITLGSSVDVQEIDGASNRGIDEIRELRDGIKYMPSSSLYRVYIIDEVHMLTLQAFNALLKTLEEPPPHVKFIFATTEAHKVPVTILSRCQKFDFKRIPIPRVIAHLRSITEKEGIEIGDAALAMIAGESEGSMRDAESLLDQVVSFTGSKVEDTHVVEILGIMDRGILFETSGAVIDGSAATCLDIVERIYTHGYDLKEFYRALMDQFRNLLISLVAPDQHLLDVTENEKEEITRQARAAGTHKLQMLMDFLIRREGDLRFTSAPRLILETTLVKMCTLGDYLSFEDLLGKLESLETRLLTSPGGAPAGGLDSKPEPRPGPRRDAPVSARAAGAQHPVGPEGDLDSIPEPRPVPQRDAGTQAPKTWDGFLAFLASRNKLMWNVLKDWTVSRMTDRSVEIIKAAQTFSASYFDDRDRYEQLVDSCRSYFERPMAVKIVTGPAAGGLKPPVKDAPATPRGGDEQLPAPVRDILHMFNGRVKEDPPVREGADPPHAGTTDDNKEELK